MSIPIDGERPRTDRNLGFAHEELLRLIALWEDENTANSLRDVFEGTKEPDVFRKGLSAKKLATVDLLAGIHEIPIARKPEKP